MHECDDTSQPHRNSQKAERLIKGDCQCQCSMDNGSLK